MKVRVEGASLIPPRKHCTLFRDPMLSLCKRQHQYPEDKFIDSSSRETNRFPGFHNPLQGASSETTRADTECLTTPGIRGQRSARYPKD